MIKRNCSETLEEKVNIAEKKLLMILKIEFLFVKNFSDPKYMEDLCNFFLIGIICFVRSLPFCV